MRVLILADIPGWIVDRITDRMISEMPAIEWTKRHYACTETAEILRLAQDCDLIHYQNSDIGHHWPRLLDAGKPVLMSIRSHRYPAIAREAAKRCSVHVINRSLLNDFPGATYIPDGLMIEPQPLRVGFAGKPDRYKGFTIIQAACRTINAWFVPATGNLRPEQMTDYYRSIDVLVCASENEGFGTPIMECLALNKPVISTRCGSAWEAQLPVRWVDRTAESIQAALLEYWPARKLEEFRWPAVCRQFEALYQRIASN